MTGSRLWPADRGDVPALRDFLQRHVLTSMFPLSNLDEFGLVVDIADHPRATRFWLEQGPEGLRGVLGLTVAGMAMPQMPGGDMGAAARALAGQEVFGITGESGQVAALAQALDAGTRPLRMNDDEPQYALDLANLVIPDGDSRLVPLDETQREVAIQWRAAYEQEVLGETAERAPGVAARGVAEWIAGGSHRVLLQDGEPVAMTGFNAALPDIVQIGGVYTPPALRGRGLARRAVALHLEEAREAGVRRATLFASSAAAARAYEAIGFRQVGRFTILLFAQPFVVPEAADG
ncbi:GNAT family N-acetyltransferase [Pseudoroseicyclus aestuarii]|uniref:Acetyltransferase (GNAT) family protein n=1 Tax=Pseudoroseicyclus aestuarii TaxID=1795041 RepID=A0A318SY34_9RHOB|nr:GNAT family N-acetyltransferase [Pseudoroseicyclus aestuarii]PYE84747.1 acetyltransferase (GNAT) family protein [Pseudoroseicyclus aestuarii]